MDWTTRLKIALDVILRVPSLFIVDSILKGTFLWPFVANLEVTHNGLLLLEDYLYLWYFLNFCGFVAAMVIFYMETDTLIKVHKIMAAGVNIFLSYYFNSRFVNEELKQEEYSENITVIIAAPRYNFLFNLAVQIIISLAHGIFQQETPDQYQGVMFKFHCPILLLPLLFRIISVPENMLRQSPLMSCLFLAVGFKIHLFNGVITVLKAAGSYCASLRSSIRNFRPRINLEYIQNDWLRLHVPNVFALFWIVRTFYISTYLYFFIAHYNDENETIHLVNTTLLSHNPVEIENQTVINDFTILWRETAVRSCDTVIALLGMTSIISSIASCVGAVITWYLNNDNEDQNLGHTAAILFFVLALQSGLTGMKPANRLVRLCRNFCLLFTMVMHFMHGTVSPLLMQISATQHHQFKKHVRPLTVCVFLLVFPVLFLFYLWQHNTANTWLLAVSSFCLEVVFKVVVSLLVYTLFMVDAYRETFWEELDDYVYYVKAFGSSIEYLFGVFLFCNGGWIMLFESGGGVRALMMCIHAYANIYVQGKTGWGIFMRRRDAVRKINLLPEASAEKLAELNDVCAICYQELTNARVTRCNHYFHGVCLRKWLYLQESCPMCQENIIQEEQNTEKNVET